MRKIKIVLTFPDKSTLEYDEQMNISFIVNKTVSDNFRGANNAEVLISNLSNQSRQKIEKAAADDTIESNRDITTISIYAGSDHYNQIFEGSLRNVKQERMETNVNTIMYAFDKTADELINKSVQSQMVADLIKEVANGLDLKLSISIENRVVENFSHFGSFKGLLNKLSADYSFSYYINDGTLVVYDKDKTDKEAKKINRTNGMLGTPKISATGCVMQVLLNSTYNLGDLVKLDASYGDFNIASLELGGGRLKGTSIVAFNNKFNALNGNYLVRNITHQGESRGNMFVTTLTTVNRLYAELERKNP